ncbi:hypothetical protein [uncultured Desulfosarcina sp.]|uniref:hypothetical protein n=1 Tax=uncultured Desulfosarcina sp. TaxID=218289 RepID=UPI0029C7BF0D|nr:hypothetical protein [uncultured Desulfosarcina sp.]
MIDNTPYIIVDNRKISPIERSSRPDSATAERTGREEQTFGIVDRVTISREARERARHQPAHSETGLTALENLSKRPPATNKPLLTYSPKQLR